MANNNDINISDPFKNGDLNIFEADGQNNQATILAQPGQFYQWPTFGVGIADYINSPTEALFLKADIAAELEKDNYRLLNYDVEFIGDTAIIDFSTEKIQ